MRLRKFRYRDSKDSETKTTKIVDIAKFVSSLFVFSLIIIIIIIKPPEVSFE